MKQGIQEFHRKYVLVPADKAANNVVVVCRLHYVNTFEQELDGTWAYLETDTDEMSVVNTHLNDLFVKFSCVITALHWILPAGLDNVLLSRSSDLMDLLYRYISNTTSNQ